MRTIFDPPFIGFDQKKCSLHLQHTVDVNSFAFLNMADDTHHREGTQPRDTLFWYAPRTPHHYKANK